MLDKPETSGDKAHTITTLDRMKTAFIDMLRGYPIYWYWGIIEHYFDNSLGEKAVESLEKDGVIQVRINGSKNNRKEYRLTAKGVQIASSFSNRKRVKDYGAIALVVGLITILLSITQLVLSYYQNPIF